ncbi:MAG: tetratricopeptide repeat protein [Pseudomonadales bacterium]|nr:tetratricopeptide repeat protein [Pseudomonadales bacterium]
MNMSISFRLMLLVSFLVATLNGCDGVEGRKHKYMEQAEISFAAEDYEKARIGYKNVLKIDPKDIPALLGFAKTLEKLQEWRGAVGKYRAVIELQPENIEAKIKLGQLYLLANEMELALKLAEEVLAKDATHPGALTLQAGAFSKAGKIQEALKLVEQAYKLDPNSIDAIVLFATLNELNKNRGAALELLEREVKNHPDSITLHTLLSKLYLSEGRLALAEKELVTLSELDKDSIAFKKQLVVFYERTKRPNEAEAVFKQIIESEEYKTQAIIGLHDLFVSRGSKADAEALLQEHIKNDKDNFDLKFKLASFYLIDNRPEIAEAMYREMVEENEVVSIKAKNRLAFLLDKQGNIEESDILVAEVLKDHPGNIEALTLRGTKHLKKEDSVNAIADLRTVLNANPENVEIIKMLASAHILNNEPSLAIDMLNAALNLNPKDLLARLQLAELYQQANQREQAIKHLEMADRLKPNDTTVLEKLAQAFMSANDAEKAKSSVKRLMSLNTTNPRPFHYYGLILQSENNHEDAITYFDEALRLKPGAVEPMSSKVRSLITLKKLDEAVSWLDETAESLNDNPVAHNLKGEILLAEKSFKEAVAAFNKAKRINPTWWVPYRNKALAAMAEGSDQGAMDALREGVEKTQGNIRLRAELANVAEKNSDYQEAIHQYEKIMDSDSNNAVAANNLAMLLVTYDSDNVVALQRAQELSKLLLERKSAQFQDTAGWVQYVSGHYDKALPLIKRALLKQPDNPEIQYHLGMTYFKINDKENAKKYLASALAAEREFRGQEKAKSTLKLLDSNPT